MTQQNKAARAQRVRKQRPSRVSGPVLEEQAAAKAVQALYELTQQTAAPDAWTAEMTPELWLRMRVSVIRLRRENIQQARFTRRKTRAAARLRLVQQLKAQAQAALETHYMEEEEVVNVSNAEEPSELGCNTKPSEAAAAIPEATKEEIVSQLPQSMADDFRALCKGAFDTANADWQELWQWHGARADKYARYDYRALDGFDKFSASLHQKWKQFGLAAVEQTGQVVHLIFKTGMRIVLSISTLANVSLDVVVMIALFLMRQVMHGGRFVWQQAVAGARGIKRRWVQLWSKPEPQLEPVVTLGIS